MVFQLFLTFNYIRIYQTSYNFLYLSNKINNFFMNKQETVYAISSQGYYNTLRPRDHPTIIQANSRNVQLSYVRCNQLYKGQSKFLSSQAEEYYKASKSMPAKSEMTKSSITKATHEAKDEISSIFKMNELKINGHQKKYDRKLISRSFHGGGSYNGLDSSVKTEKGQSRQQIDNKIYEYEETTKVFVPKNMEQLNNFRSNNFQQLGDEGSSNKQFRTIKRLLDGARVMEDSIHDNETETPLKKSFIYNPQSPHRAQKKDEQTKNISSQYLHIRLNKAIESSYLIPQQNRKSSYFQSLQNTPDYVPTSTKITSLLKIPQFNEKAEDSPKNEQIIKKLEKHFQDRQQISRLRRQLQLREKQLKQTKQALHNSEKKNKTLEMHVKKLQLNNGNTGKPKIHDLKIYSNLPINAYKNKMEISTRDNTKQCISQNENEVQTINGFLYFTLLVVLFSKQLTCQR